MEEDRAQHRPSRRASVGPCAEVASDAWWKMFQAGVFGFVRCNLGELNACVGHLNTTLQESAWVAVLSQRSGRNFSKTGENYGRKEDKSGSGCFKHEAACSFLRASQQGLHTGCLAWFLKKNRFCKVALLFRGYTGGLLMDSQENTALQIGRAHV